MKNLLLLLLGCLAAGCAGAPERRLVRWPELPVHASLENRKAFYDAHRVESASGNSFSADATTYDLPYCERYFYFYGGATTGFEISHAARLEHGKNLMGVAPLLGAVLGAAGGIIGTSTPSPVRVDKSNWVLNGIGYGAAIGTVVYSIQYFICTLVSEHQAEDAMQRLNKKLRQKLQLDVVPLPGGAKAGLSVGF